MSKNEKVEIKSCKKGQAKVNNKGRNDNKFPADEGRTEPDDISKAFPNFSVLTEEERLAFFQALTEARKNVEKRGVITRKRFGTVHDEYLKYFHQNDQDEEAKQEGPKFAVRKNSVHFCIDQSDSVVDREHPKEKKNSLSILSVQDTEASRESSTPIAFAQNSWEQESLILMETDKVVNLFLKKKKRNEKKAESLKSDEIIFEKNSKENNWVAQRFSRESDTPKFDALSPEEKMVFFRILQEARDNVIDKNPNKKCHVLPLDDIIRRYQGDNKVTTVFSTTQDAHKCGKTKRDLKVTVTVTSKDNERLLKNHSHKEKDAFMSETFRKCKPENPCPLEKNKNESKGEEDKDDCKSEEAIKKLGNELKEDSFKGCKTFISETPPNELCKDSYISLESFPTNNQTKLCNCKSRNKKEKQFKKKENPKNSEIEQNAQLDSRLCLAEKNMIANVQSVQNNAEPTKKPEKLDCWPLASTDDKISEHEIKTQPSLLAEKSKEPIKKLKAKEEVTLKIEESESSEAMEEKLQKAEKKSELAMPVTQENGLIKKVSFIYEKPKEENTEALKREDESQKKERNIPGPEAGENTLNRVMLVNGDVVGKIKRLVWYLEAKTNKNARLEKEYLKLLVDYADYLSKVLESLILKKEKQQKQQRNTCEAPELRYYCHNFVEKTEAKPQSYKSDSCLASKPDIKKECQSVTPTDDRTLKEPTKGIDSILPELSDSDGSEGETRFKQKKDDRDRVLTTKIRLLQDLLRQRAEFVEGSFDDFKIVQFPEKTFVPKEKTPTVKLLTEDNTKEEKDKKKFFRSLLNFLLCRRKTKKNAEQGIIDNLRGEAIRVDLKEGKKKDAASATLNQATLEVLKAAERKKIIDKYFADS